MKKIIFLLTLTLLFTAGMAVDVSAVVELGNVQTKDSAGLVRTYFSTAEKVTFSVETNNTMGASGMVTITYAVYDPVGTRVLYNTGAIPGTAGTGGVALRNVPIKQFFSSQGYYTLKVEAKDSSSFVLITKKEVKFKVFSPFVTLVYPVDNTTEIADQPLSFRWVSNGASKYRIVIDDNAGFYHPLINVELNGTVYTYNEKKVEDFRRLLSGKKYYWKVEGLDNDGKVITTSPAVYTFSIKSEVKNVIAHNVGITGFRLEEKLSVENKIVLHAMLVNNGNQVEHSIRVKCFVNGIDPDVDETVESVLPGKTADVMFTMDPSLLKVTRSLVLTLKHELVDDHPEDNIYISRVNLSPNYFRAGIIGRVTLAGTTTGIAGVFISCSGNAAGKTVTSNGGVYRIEDLPLGSYVITAQKQGYTKSFSKEVELSKPGVMEDAEFELKEIFIVPSSSTKSGVFVPASKEPIPQDLAGQKYWRNFVGSIVSQPVMEQLSGYILENIDGVSWLEFEDLARDIQRGKVAVIDTGLKVIK